MSLMSDIDVLEAIGKGEIRIEPFERKFLGPDSLDIQLGNEVLVSKTVGKTIDPNKPENFFESRKIDGSFVLEPGQFVLGTTKERISLSDAVSAQIEGRSSLGRLGIMVHMTAGIIHAGFGAKEPSSLTLEIYSVNPNSVYLHAGMKIAQLSFFRLNRKASKGYDFMPTSKYVSQDKPLAPRAEK
ncbi:dCTP deaminase, dUMP-forming [uncultured archaeon]|nr:dCTP deaminase, dUMP-forming [uncultured archaeon]